jgi:ubiquitin-conjugating enzyme E2 Q
VKPIKDNLYHWEVRFFDFDKEEPLAADLKKTKEKAILLHVTFPQTYPFDPPFIRVIKPRTSHLPAQLLCLRFGEGSNVRGCQNTGFAFRTGHVTIGGSICTEMLTRSGWTPGALRCSPTMNVNILSYFLDRMLTHSFTSLSWRVCCLMCSQHG